MRTINLFFAFALCSAVMGCSLGNGDGVNAPCTTDQDCNTVETGLACEAPTQGTYAGQVICVPSCAGNPGVCLDYGLVCNQWTGLNGESQENRCRRLCGAGLACPNGMVCLNRGNVGFCFPGQGQQSCTQGCPNGSPCTSRAQCASGHCQNGYCVQCTSAADCGGNACVNFTCQGGGCATGQTQCGNACVYLGSDPSNCGLCGRSCGGQQCQNGTCTNTCNGGTYCNGICTYTQTDPSNCGSCGRVCGNGFSCQGGNCVQGGGGNGSPGSQCVNDGDCYTGYWCVGRICTVPLCLTGVNPNDYTMWGTNGAGDDRGHPPVRVVRVSNNGTLQDMSMYCSTGWDIGSVTTPNPNVQPGCLAAGFSNTNNLVPCRSLAPKYPSSGVFK